MKAFKVILALIGLVIVLVVGAFVYLLSNAGDIVEQVIESQGPKLTRTNVTLGEADIRIREGRGELKDLIVANPEGYTAPNALHAQNLALQIEPQSVVGDVIVVKELLVEGVTVTAEQQGMTTNLQELLKAVQQAAAGPEQPTQEDGQSDIRLMVEKVRFADNRLNLITEQHGEYAVELPPLELENLGNKQQGLTPAQLGKAVLQPVLAQARDAAQDRLEQELKDRAEDKLKEKAKEALGEDAQEKVEQLRGLLN